MKTRRKNKWGELLECLAVEELQIVLLEVLFAAEEDPFRFGKAFRLGEFGSGEFKRTGEIRDLETAKARIAPRHRQETFPRAGDSGFRPCQRILNQILRRYARGRGNETGETRCE